MPTTSTPPAIDRTATPLRTAPAVPATGHPAPPLHGATPPPVPGNRASAANGASATHGTAARNGASGDGAAAGNGRGAKAAESAKARAAAVRASEGDWGGSGHMSAFETVLWRAEADRSMRSPVLALEELDRAPDWDRFVATHERLVREVPRLTQRVVEAPLDLGTPRWADDPHFDLRFHVWRARLPEGAGWAELLEAAARLAMAPFDRTRPPWEAVLYEGLPGGGAAYLIKLHHSLTDGLGAVQLMERLHTREPEADPAPERPTGSRGQGGTTPLGVIAHQVRSDVSALPGLLRMAGSGALGALSDPAAAVRSATRYGSSLRRVLGTLSDPSPLLSERGVAWRFSALEVPLKPLRVAARAGGGTLHDAYIASLLGGYRRYHAALGRPVDSVPIAIPISVRRPGDPAGGNRITATRFSAPIGTADPAARIRQVRELVGAARSEPALGSMGLVFPALVRLPAALSTQLVGSMTRANDLQASFVPGGRGDRYLAGSLVRRVYPYAPRPGCPAMITLATHRDTACVGVNFDPASFTRPELLVRSLLDGFAEVLSLAPGDARPSAPGLDPHPGGRL
jgi:diacylglycerol O-acyltransferase / wax synthase